MINKIGTIKNPQDIARAIFRGAESEHDEFIEKNQERIERFQEPLAVPAWNVKQMLKNIDKLTEAVFAQTLFQDYANEHPYNGESSSKKWAATAKVALRDIYLVLVVPGDDDLLQQMCEVWHEMTPEPTLTNAQRLELANLQKQADDLVEHAKGLVAEFTKLAEQEKDIIRKTQSKYDERIADQVKYVDVNLQYYKEYVKKW